MSKILKYEVSWTLLLPKDAKFLKVELQDGKSQSWWLVNPDSPKVARNFRVVATGEDINLTKFTYLDTWQDGQFIWHWFEEIA